MTLKQLTLAAVELGTVLQKEQDFRSLLVKWLEKQLKAKSTTLSTLALLAKSHGADELKTMFGSVSEPTLRSLAKNLDPHHPALASLSRQQIADHIFMLAEGSQALTPRPARMPKSAKGAKLPKAAQSGQDLLERSKYPKVAH